MADIHILDGNGATVRVVCHVPVPSGDNAAGVSKQTAWKNSGKAAASVMAIGTGPGQIAQAEADALAAGTLAEIQLEAWPEAKATPADRTAMYRELWGAARAALLDQLQGLRWFGATLTRA